MSVIAKSATEVPATEVSPKATRRRFTAKYKLRVLRKADACTAPGAIAELLRREGLYSSHLAEWRRLREQGDMHALAPQKRGPKARVADARDKRLVEQEREIVRLRARAERAEALVEISQQSAAR